jgi:hypothetical protein
MALRRKTQDAMAPEKCRTSRDRFVFIADTDSISAIVGRPRAEPVLWLRCEAYVSMATVKKTPAEVAVELAEFAKAHRLLLPNPECLKSHVARYLTLGHCPCVEVRENCPCDEVLSDVERMGRCECGILIDPERVCMRKNQRNGL